MRFRNFIRRKTHRPTVRARGGHGENSDSFATRFWSAPTSEPVVPFLSVEDKFRSVDVFTVPELGIGSLTFGKCGVRPAIFPAQVIPVFQMKRDRRKIFPQARRIFQPRKPGLRRRTTAASFRG